MNEKEKLDEEVFKQAYIPRNLEEVYDVDRDVDVVARGE
jgi:RIO kinase 1